MDKPEIRDTKAAPDTTISPVVPEPTKPTEPVVDTEKPVIINVTQFDITRDRQVAISKRMGEIIAEHDGLVSNIPAIKTHEYWALKAELDALRTTP